MPKRLLPGLSANRKLSEQTRRQLYPRYTHRQVDERNCLLHAGEQTAQTWNLEAQREQASKEVVAQIHRVVDAYMLETTDGMTESEGVHVVNDLKQILGETAVIEPAAFVMHWPRGHALVLFYSIGAGGGASSSTLLAYLKSENRQRLVDVTGSDMDSYGNLWVRRPSMLTICGWRRRTPCDWNTQDALPVIS